MVVVVAIAVVVIRIMKSLLMCLQNLIKQTQNQLLSQSHAIIDKIKFATWELKNFHANQFLVLIIVCG